MTGDRDSRICAEVQQNLPAWRRGELGRVRRRLLAVHLRRCNDCRAEAARQDDVSAGLAALAAPVEPPPEGLLDDLLAAASAPGIAGRAAVPARGAVSGARPALSLALLVAGAAVGTGAGYAGWRSARAVGRRVRRRRA
ncbi:MAG TPA: zf-HC2 domain-containing protein [Mycobacteriales bacterium]|nr:zf-HC2 domain-containing protein [Mycobacteriales bacterium]